MASQILDFSASINPLGPPPSTRKAFIGSYKDIGRYPDPYGESLKAALAARHGLNAAQVLIGNGSTQLIYLLCAALRPQRALIVAPAFSEYGNALLLGGAAIRTLTLSSDNCFRFPTERFIAMLDKGCDIVFLATPNSVTGKLIPMTALEKIARVALARKTFVVVDEAFIDFAEAQSAQLFIRNNPYLIVLRSLTKYYAMPGLRLGYLLAKEERVAQLATHCEPWSVNTPAMRVALACLKDASFKAKTQRWFEEERKFLTEGLLAIKGFHPFRSQTNFLLIKIAKSGNAATGLRPFLISRKILVRGCNSFAGLGAGYFRVALRRRRDNQRLLAALREWTASSDG